MKTNPIFNFNDFGCNMLCQAMNDGGYGSDGGYNGWLQQKEHIPHYVYKTIYGPYGSYTGYVECLYCENDKYWGYVFPTGDGYGYVDWDGDGYANAGHYNTYVYPYGDQYGDPYGGYGSGEDENDEQYYAYGDYGYGEGENEYGYGYNYGYDYGYDYGYNEGTDHGNGNVEPDDDNGNETNILPDVHLSDPDNFVPWYNGANCNELAKEIQRNYGCGEGSPAHVYQLMIEESSENNTELVYYGDDPATNYQNAIDAINRHLDNGKVIMMGVNYELNHGVNEGTTDHFINITDREYNSETGCYEYIFTDCGTSDVSLGVNSQNRLIYDPNAEGGPTFRGKTAYDDKLTYTVTQVRPNDGNYEGTIAQWDL